MVPVTVPNGGFGVSSPTPHAILIGEGTSPVNQIVLTAGQILIGTSSGDPVGGTLTQGTRATITSASGSITIAGPTPAIPWVLSASGTQLMTINTGYINGGTSVTYILPTIAAIGTVLNVAGSIVGNWTITQHAGQNIQNGSASTTVGVTGSLSSSNQYDQVSLVCVAANTTWCVHTRMGTLTVV